MRHFGVITALCSCFLSACIGSETELGPSTVKQASADQKIYIDPVTGLPTTPPAADLQARQPHSIPRKALPAPVEKTHADGSVSVDLKGRFQPSLIANQDCNGKLQVTHDKKDIATIRTEECLNNNRNQEDK